MYGAVFAFEFEGQVIGTIRLIPCRFGLTLTEQLLRPLVPTDDDLWVDCWEVGRLALAPEYRSGQDLLKRCLFLTLDRLCASEAVENLVASCSHVLSRLYRRFGFKLICRDVMFEPANKAYSLIHGRPETVFRQLSSVDTPQTLCFPPSTSMHC